MKTRSVILFIVIAVACLALAVGAVLLAQNIAPDITGPTGANDRENAGIRCKEVITASLRNMDQAKYRSQKITSLGNNRYQVTGTIDAPDASGVTVRGNYICVFNFNTKFVDMLSLEGDDIWKPLKK
ncbi:MAG: hypothetical protein WCG34_06995 [Leptolinea sp.]